MANGPVSPSSGPVPRDHLFISYAGEDHTLAKWLALRLTAEGYAVWMDSLRLLGGESYPRDIDQALKERTFRLIAVLTRHSIGKPNPRKERTLGLNIARARGESPAAAGTRGQGLDHPSDLVY